MKVFILQEMKDCTQSPNKINKFKLAMINVMHQWKCPLEDCVCCHKSNTYIGHTAT